VDEFIRPLRAEVVEKRIAMADGDIQKIFRNVELIANLHGAFLKELEKQGQEGNLGSVFLTYANFMKMYTEYVSTYEQSIEILTKHRDNKKLYAFLDSKRKDPATNNMDLMSYLIMPVQRIPRYEMLLNEIVKRSDVSNPQHASLVEAAAKIKEIAVVLNERKRQIESMSETLSLQSRLKNLDWNVINRSKEEPETLVIPSRRFLRKAMLDIRVVTEAARTKSPSPHHRISSSFAFLLRRKDDWKKREIVLFNDMIMWISGDKFKGCISFSFAEVKSTSSDMVGEDRSLGIQITGTNSVRSQSMNLQLVFESEADRDTWFRDISENIS